MTSSADVVSWNEAMEQCGDDEEFLLELLSDLKEEVDGQMVKMNEILEDPSDAPFHRMKRSAHVIKGASSNLMCKQLQKASHDLEHAATIAHEQNPSGNDQLLLSSITELFRELQKAVDNYNKYIDSIGL